MKFFRKTASPRVDEFNNLYRERVCKVDYNKVKKKFEEKSRPGLMAVLQLTNKIRNVSRKEFYVLYFFRK